MKRKDVDPPPQRHAGKAPTGGNGTDTSDHISAILAIGGSDGGLEPIGQLLSAIPGDIGLSVVLAQKSQLETKALLGFLAGCTTMPAEIAATGTIMSPNRVYVTQPGAYFESDDTALRFNEACDTAVDFSLDLLMRSLASRHSHKTIGIIFSGAGLDGAQGLKALRDSGGLAIVQDPREASRDGLPRYAAKIATPDYVLPVRAMPEVVANYATSCLEKASQAESDDLDQPRLEPAIAPPFADTGSLHELCRQSISPTGDVHEFITASSYATIFVDEALNIKCYNKMARDIFLLDDHSYDRTLSELMSIFSDADLQADIRMARDCGLISEREIMFHSGAWYRRSVAPYRSDTSDAYGTILSFRDITELKEMQIAREGVRDRGDETDDTMVAPMAAIDESFNILFANDAFRRDLRIHDDILALQPSSRRGSSGSMTAFLMQTLSKHFSQRAGEDEPLAGTMVIEGARRAWRLSLSPLTLSAQKSRIALVSLEPIFRPKRLDRAAITLVVDKISSPLVATDISGRIWHANTDACDLFGYGSRALLGQRIEILIAPEFHTQISHLVEAFSDPGGPDLPRKLFQLRGLSKDGTLMPLTVVVTTLDSSDGRVFLIQLQDQRALMEARAEREHVQTKLDQEIAAMKQLHDAAFRVVSRSELSKALEDILNSIIEFQKADFVQIQLYDPKSKGLTPLTYSCRPGGRPEQYQLIADGDGSIYERAMYATIIAPNLDDVTKPALTPLNDDSICCRAAVALPILTRSGNLLGVLSMHFHEPHQPTERDLWLIDLYVRIVGDLLDGTHFRQGPHLKLNTSEPRFESGSDLLAATLHDLRQPLQSMRLLEAALQQQVIDPSARHSLKRLNDATEQMTNLIDGLLDLQSIETGQLTPELKDISLASVITQARHDFSPHATSKGLTLRCVDSSLRTRGDLRLLTRILGNLISNAIKYTDSGKVLIGCRRRGTVIRIEIWDTGIGIPAHHVHSIFDKYYRVIGPEVERPGLGLGLHIVKRFSDLMHYQLDIRSCPTKGTMIALIVPSASSREILHDSSNGQKTASKSTPTLLLIEDDPTQLAALSSLLRQQGYRVATARNRRDALASLQANLGYGPHVIITDLNLKDGPSGTVIIQDVRKELGVEIPALILSGRLPDRRISQSGDISVFIKPVKVPALLAAIEALARQMIPDWHAIKATARDPVDLMPPSDPPPEIAVIDDDPGIRSAIKAMIASMGHEVTVFASAEAYINDLNRRRFQCVIVDASLTGMSGLDLQARLREEKRCPPFIFLTASTDISLTVEAMRHGAADVLRKPVEATTLHCSLNRILEQPPSPRPILKHVSDVEARLATLTRRERQIMERIVIGQLNKNIAVDLGISERTIEHHRQSIMRKMGVKSLAMLVRMTLP